MIEYLFLIFIPLFFYFSIEVIKERNIGVLYSRKQNQYTIILFFSLFFFLLCLRDVSVGTDLLSYLPFFHNISSVRLSEAITDYTFEIGYTLFNWILNRIMPSDRLLVFWCALIPIFAVCYLYTNESGYALVAISVFLISPLFSFFFSGLRQSIAIAIIALSFFQIKGKHPIRFIGFVAFACLFHKSAMIFLFAYPIYWIRMDARILPVLLVTELILVFANSIIFRFAMQFMPVVYQLRYSEIESTGAYTALILYTVFLLYCFLMTTDDVDSDFNGMRNFLVIAILIQCFAPIHNIAMRFGYYFILFVPVVMSRVSFFCRSGFARLVKLSRFVLVVFFFGYFFYNLVYGADVLRIYPYMFFFE